MVQRKKFGPNLYQAKSGVISFWVGGPKKKNWNLCQAKSGAISFWVGGQLTK